MRAALITLLLAACGGDGPATPDAQPADAAVGDSFTVPIGASCDEAQTVLCARGLGICQESLCRRQCNPGSPRCEADEIERHRPGADGGDRCTCLPME
jgi:hypothetical protein